MGAQRFALCLKWGLRGQRPRNPPFQRMRSIRTPENNLLPMIKNEIYLFYCVVNLIRML